MIDIGLVVIRNDDPGTVRGDGGQYGETQLNGLQRTENALKIGSRDTRLAASIPAVLAYPLETI